MSERSSSRNDLGSPDKAIIIKRIVANEVNKISRQ
jgi:hypothetical protein